MPIQIKEMLHIVRGKQLVEDRDIRICVITVKTDRITSLAKSTLRLCFNSHELMTIDY